MKNKTKKIIKLIPAILFFVLLVSPMIVGAQTSVPTEVAGQATSLTAVIQAISKWLFIIIGTIAVIGFLIAGVLYLTAAGDEDRLKQAKRAMLYSIIGIIVALAGGVAVNVAMNLWKANGNL